MNIGPGQVNMGLNKHNSIRDPQVNRTSPGQEWSTAGNRGLRNREKKESSKRWALAQEMGAAEGNLKKRVKGPRVKARRFFF